MKLLKKILNSLMAYSLGISCPSCNSRNVELVNFPATAPPAKNSYPEKIELEQAGTCQSRDGIYMCHGCSKQFTNNGCA